MPRTNELARLYTINPATAAQGVNLLVDGGILYKRREAFAREHIAPMLAEAKSLGITKEELLDMIGEKL